MTRSPALVLGLFYGLAAGALWGGVFLAPKLLAEFTPFQMAAGRYLAYGFASLLLLGPMLRTVLHQVTWRDWRDLLGLSLLGNIAYYVALSLSVQTTGVALASLIVGMLPVTITLAGARRGEGPPLRALLAPLLLITMGVLCINVAAFQETTAEGGRWLLGLLGAAAALACWTAYAVWNARRLAARPHFTSHQWSLLTGVATGVLALLLAIPAFGKRAHDTADWGVFWIVSAAAALGASVIGNGLWNAASRLLPISLSGQLIVFETLFALLYGYLYEQRWPGLLEAAAIVLMVVGVLWSMQIHRPAPADELT